MTIRVGINGFGRIGRNFFRAAKERGADIDFVAANDLLSKELMAHLLKYDTILGTWDRDVSLTDDGIAVDGDELKILVERDPKALPWGELGVDMVIERSLAVARQHRDRVPAGVRHDEIHMAVTIRISDQGIIGMRTGRQVDANAQRESLRQCEPG